MSRTLTYLESRKGARQESALLRAPQLVLAMDCANPCARPARFSLVDLDEVVLGRGPVRDRARVREGQLRRLRLRLPDRFMSSSHLRLVREAGRWYAEDAGSKNGSFLNDERLERARLEDGDLLVAGQMLLLFRGAMDVRADELDLDLTGTAAADAPVATLNPELARMLAGLMQVAASPVPVLVRGATGTGKELLARAIHRRAGRGGRFVAVNCGALPPSLITSELFGVRRGAYSGAGEDRAGFVRSAHGGTLFLDEIAELPLEAQAALLRVLQEGEVVPLGSHEAVVVDVKLVAATHRDLGALVERGEFREDLYARVAGYEVELPPLAERREDIGLILGTLLDRERRRAVSFAPDAARALFAYPWPRNVRELEHRLLSALAVGGDGPIELEHLSVAVRAATPLISTTPAADVEGRFVDLVREHAGNVSAIARALGTSRSQVRRIAGRLGVDIAGFRNR